eukprot:scaffold194936_cov21-Tisochrysis_lutea.AAC.1
MKSTAAHPIALQEHAAANRPQFYSKNDSNSNNNNGGAPGDVSGQKRTSEKEIKKPEIARKPFQLLSVSGSPGRGCVSACVHGCVSVLPHGSSSTAEGLDSLQGMGMYPCTHVFSYPSRFSFHQCARQQPPYAHGTGCMSASAVKPCFLPSSNLQTSILREYLALEMKNDDLPFPFDPERILDDF